MRAGTPGVDVPTPDLAPDVAPAVPRPVQVARGLLTVVALGHVVIPVAIGFGSGFGFGGTARSDGAVAGAAAIHVPLLALTLFLASRLASGRPWTRRMTTVSQLLSLAFGVVLWSSPTTCAPLVPVLGAVQLAIVALLWRGPTARRFFAAVGERDV